MLLSGFCILIGSSAFQMASLVYIHCVARLLTVNKFYFVLADFMVLCYVYDTNGLDLKLERINVRSSNTWKT